MNEQASICAWRIDVECKSMPCEDISIMQIRGKMGRVMMFWSQASRIKMEIHLNMFSTLMEDWIDLNLNCTCIIDIKRGRLKLWKITFRKHSPKPKNFGASWGLGSVFCFSGGFGYLILFLTLPQNRGTSKIYTFLWWIGGCLGHPTQLASQYTMSWSLDFVGKNYPCFEVPRRYLMIHLITAKWRLQGFVMNWLTLLIAWEMLGHVMVQ